MSERRPLHAGMSQGDINAIPKSAPLTEPGKALEIEILPMFLARADEVMDAELVCEIAYTDLREPEIVTFNFCMAL